MSDTPPLSPPDFPSSTAGRPGGPAGGPFVPDARIVPARHGWQWLVQGWELFKAQPLAWWLVLLIGWAVFVALSMIPLVNVLAAVGSPVLMAGWGSCARSAMRDGQFDITQVFDGCRRRPGQLLLAGLLYLALIVAAVVLAATMFGGTEFLGAISHVNVYDPEELRTALGASLGFFLVAAVLISCIVATIVYAPYLIQEYDVSAMQAMVLSLKASLRNMPAGGVWFLAYFGLAILASIPFALGWVVLGPVAIISIYTSYRDIFVAPQEAAVRNATA